jgi:hypothetical protein
MSLHKQLRSVVKSYISEIGLLRDFVVNVDKTLSRKLKRKPKKEFTQEHAEELRAVGEAIKNAVNGKSSDTHIEISEEISNFILQKIIPIKHKSFLSEMALSYLISYQEAFIKDYIYEIFIHRKNLLRSGATITYEEINSHSSMKALIRALAQKEVDSIGYGSVDDTAEYLKKKFNIDITKHNKWVELREANFRRNIIIHNRSRTNDTYCKKTGFKSRNQHLTTSNKYVLNSADTVISVINFIDEKLSIKLHLKKEPNKKLNSVAATKRRAG